MNNNTDASINFHKKRERKEEEEEEEEEEKLDLRLAHIIC